MLRVSSIFLILGAIALFLADFEIVTLSPEAELSKIAAGFLAPSFTRAFEASGSFIDTLVLALASVSIAALIGAAIAPWYQCIPVRIFMTMCRSVHELFWAILLMPLFRLSPFCGALALVIPFTGIFAKIFREIYDESDKSPLIGIPRRTGGVSRFLYGILPGILIPCWKYTVYRLECGMRSSAVLGFLGLPTVGFYLETLFAEGQYDEAAGILYCFFALVWVVRTVVPWFLLLAGAIYSVGLVLTSFEMAKNVSQFFFELLPWPLRGEQSWAEWGGPVIDAILVGGYNTVVLSLGAVVVTGITSLLLFPFVSKIFTGAALRLTVEAGLIVVRTTPELIIAYVLLLVLGPSMLPAFIAMVVHNVAVIAHLVGGWSESFDAPIGAVRRRIDKYCYWVVPRMFGQYFAYLLYRWEVIIRESALLGIIGVYTLGFYIDAAIHKDHLDVALVIILASSLLTLLVDGISFLVRRQLSLSGVVHSRPA